MLMVIGLFGCKSMQSISAASSDGAPGTGTVSAPSGLVQDAYVTDPTFNNMNAFRITIPEHWKLRGVVFQPGKCVQYPSAVYRATGADGQSFSEAMPPFGWVWGTGPRAAIEKNKDCLPLDEKSSAEDFLKYLAGTLNVDSMTPTAVPAVENERVRQELRAAQQKNAQSWQNTNLQAPKHTVTLAQAEVTFRSGSSSMKGLLKTRVDCTETTYAGMRSMLQGMASTPPSTVDHCTAYVGYIAAPASQYAVVTREWNAPGMGGHGGENDWFMAYMNRSNDQAQKFIEQGNADFARRYAANDAQFRQLQARAQQFQHDQDARQQMHQQFLDSMQRSTDSSMNNAARATQARTTAASDMVDMALDRQTVRDATTGNVYKITNQVRPGGDLQKVHGNGTAIQ